MGILDDAIREHLELKRSAGADADEIARLERAAFGADDTAAAPAPADAEAEVAAPAESPPADVPAEVAPEVPEPVQAHEPELVEQPTRQFTLEELEDAEQRVAPPEDVAPPPAPEREPAPELEPSTPQTQEEVDELEETPDFLQETPEHDRLWFEQKPPKDFDF